MNSGTETAKQETAPFTGITINYQTIHESRNALQILLGTPIKPASAFRLKSIFKQINARMSEFEQKRVELCRKLGVKNEETGNFDIKEENQETFNFEMHCLFLEPMQIVAKPLKINDLGNANISVDVLMNLEWLIDG